ncbi:MAG TPA: class I SAM-dependent methyltransferase, partial [Terriglobia bacterium]|nr:class I SAM-dependent methyltransferase [Terriglobia bacterium]
MPSEAVHRLLFENAQLPVLQNRTYATQWEARACVKGDVRLVEDLRSGLVYNATFRPELVVYDDDYQNEQIQSPSFHKHLDSVAEIVGRHLWRNGLVEVGCGKGSFFEILAARGFDIEGFDPAYEGKNPRIRKRAFDGTLRATGRGVILRHVLEHIQDPVEFLFEIQRANGGEGRIYIEVPCFEWICEHRAWFDIFYEHVNYFRMADFNRMFGTVLESGRLFSGQYLYVVAELASLRRP